MLVEVRKRPERSHTRSYVDFGGCFVGRHVCPSSPAMDDTNAHGAQELRVPPGSLCPGRTLGRRGAHKDGTDSTSCRQDMALGRRRDRSVHVNRQLTSENDNTDRSTPWHHWKRPTTGYGVFMGISTPK